MGDFKSIITALMLSVTILLSTQVKYIIQRERSFFCFMAYLTFSTGDIIEKKQDIIFNSYDSAVLSIKENLTIRNRLEEILEEEEEYDEKEGEEE